MSSEPSKKIIRRQVGGLPLIESVVRRLGLRELLAEAVPSSGREAMPPSEVLTLLAINMTIARDPLYELSRWASGMDLRVLGHRQPPRLGDDRCGRALDRLHLADRASLTTRLAVSAVSSFDLRVGRIHNDSTTVSACGRIPGRTRTGLELRLGHSKAHRPDLRQLVYSLSVADDGAVPVHHCVYPGNRNDETTHIETWDALREIHGGPDFLYVADCKLCTQEQLGHIVGNGGRAVTVVPRNFTEVRDFLGRLRAENLPRRFLWRRPRPSKDEPPETFHLFDGDCRTEHGYPLYWIHSSEKRRRDRRAREERLLAAEAALTELAPRLNARRLKRQPDILRAVADILDRHRLKGLLEVRLRQHAERWRVRRRGRPGKCPGYQTRCRMSYSLEWGRNQAALTAEARTDGVFPLLCTDPALPPRDVLKTYKFQPRLEKRFAQFKSIHRAAPLLFKRIERVEANMFLFFVALMIQALIERTLRRSLARNHAPPLKLYPEERDAPHPTTSQLLKTFEPLASYTIMQDGRPVEECHDELDETHRRVLKIFELNEDNFWKTP